MNMPQGSNAPPPALDLSIVTFNSARWIAGFFKSLARQDFPLSSIAIFVTDNGSTDGSVELLEAARAALPAPLRGWSVERAPNRGFGAGHNGNLRRSDAAWFLVTNIDIEFEPDSLIRILECATADAETCACWEFRQKPYEHPKLYNPVSQETSWASSACVLFRRAALLAVGGYDERIFLYGEDVELSFRLRDHGYTLRYCPSAVVWHFTYEAPDEVKPAQFFGSVLANFLIRLRYGTLRQMAAIPGMWFRLFVRGPAVPHRRRGLLAMAFRLAWLAPGYLLTRKRSHATFPIRGFDYELRRDGAFFAYPRTSMAKAAGYPLATVIVRTYQGRMGFLREATRSIVRQTYPNVELVVVEDGQTGFAREYVESLAEPGRLATRYIANPKGERARAGNAALAAATGKYIMFLDDDDLIFAEHLEVLVETLCRKPELGAAYANAWEVETIVHSTEPLRYTETLHKAVFRQPFCRPLMWVRNFIPIQAIVFDRRLYERHGGFDVDCPPLEDWNLWTRYCAYDDFVYVEKTTSMYRTPADADERARRQGVLDVTYARAVSRQDVLSFQFTPQQFLELHRELNRYEHADFGTYHQMKAMFKRNALGMWVVRRAKLAARLLLGKESG